MKNSKVFQGSKNPLLTLCSKFQVVDSKMIFINLES